MISKEMYELLKKIPRTPKSISYNEINGSKDEKKYQLICEAAYTGYDYITVSGILSENGSLSLTEKGQAEIEEYEQAERNQKIVEKSLIVARVAMWAAIGSAVVAIVSLVKMFC